MRRRTIGIVTAAAMLATISLACGALGAEFPRAQLDESERHLTRGYSYLLDRDHWNALGSLSLALRANTYLVDYYLLNALVLQRVGDGDGARASLSSYLEVRPMDRTASHILRAFVEQDRLLRSVVSARPVPVRWQMSARDIQGEWGTGIVRPFTIKGLGKANALGGAVCLTDFLGDRAYIVADGQVRSVPIERPAALLPMGDGTFTLAASSGDVWSFSTHADLLSLPGTPISMDLIGTVPSWIADAEPLSGNEFAVADPVSREVAFYAVMGGGEERQILRRGGWAPPDPPLGVEPGTELLFEPVALDRYADWLAVADRGNGRVYVMNAVSMRDAFSVDVDAPRDVLWAPLGELFVLTEHGELLLFGVDFAERTFSPPEALDGELQDAWALFRAPGGGAYCLDVGASRLHKATMLPAPAFAQGFLGADHPTVALESGRESFLLDATLSSPFGAWAQTAPLSVRCIWNERTLRSMAWWQGRAPFDGLLLHRALPRTQPLPMNARTSRAERGMDVWPALSALWALHRETLTNVIVDSSIPFTMDEMLALLRFCLMNGLELDVWARDVPSLALERASAFTGGRTIFSLDGPLELEAPLTRMKIQIPLPMELSSSGYPSRSMLSIYMDVGLAQTQAWLPLWPDMLGR